MQVTAQAGQGVQQVREYDLFLDVDYAGLKYDGRVTIDLDSTQDIVLDAVGLQIVSVKSGSKSIPFKHSGKFLEVQTGKFSGPLDIQFKGKVSDNFTGFYKASYGDGYLLSTHLESVQARKVLPCLDHPAHKAVFKVAMRVDPELSVISNMPIESEKNEAGKKTVTFQKTPKMATYLLYLGVGKFVEERSRHGKTELYSAYGARPKGAIKTEFSFEVARKVLDFYEQYFGIPYSLPKLHQIAVPEFAYGAMENWGAITYREILLHVDKDTSVKVKKRVAGVIAHEIAHMWFGDLVTMKWWDDIWLNESFATFMGQKAVDSAYPQWAVWEDFVRTETAGFCPGPEHRGALARDGLKSTHPIEARVKDPEEIEELFDEISYGKGASILRMIDAYIGDENFRKGVGTYLQQFRYSNASGRDLWHHLQEASGAEVSRIMEAWVSKAGYPIVTASLSGGKLRLEQERFLLAGGIEKRTWPIPLTMSVDGKPQRMLFEKEKEQIDVSNPRSLRLNIDKTGFYVVRYEGKEIQSLVWNGKLTPLDKWGLVTDAIALVLSGHVPFNEYLTLIERYETEQDYLPAFEVSDQLDFLYKIAPGKMAERSRKFHASQMEILRNKKDDNSSYLRGFVAARLTMLDRAFAKEQGSKINDLSSIEPDMKLAVIKGYARTSNDYEGLIDRYKKSTTDEDRLRYLEGLVSFEKPELVRKTLDFAIEGNVKRQDIRNMVAYAASNPDAKSVTWEWFRSNVEKLIRIYEGTAQLSGIMRSYLPIIGVGRHDEVESLLRAHPVPGADATIERLRIYNRLAKSINELGN
jgi:tricorn protease interacting factor F2/3